MGDLKDTRTIYLRSRDKTELSRPDVVSALSEKGYKISESSLKDYETGKTVPKPKIVMALAELYNTPELKWLHCSKNCNLGEEIVKASEEFGVSDIYRTFFDLIGAFNAIQDVQKSLHSIVLDDELSPEEEDEWDYVIGVLDEITESANELKVWAESHRSSQA